MSERLIDPGFELGSSAWAITQDPPGATVTRTSGALARSGSWYVDLVSATGVKHGTIGQSLTLYPARAYQLRAYVKLLLGTAYIAAYVQDDKTGDIIPGSDVLLDGASAQAQNHQWELLNAVFTLDRPACLCSVIFKTAGSVFGEWLLDDCSLQQIGGIPVSRHLHAAFADLTTKLISINGASGGYYHDLGSRVYCRTLTPHDASSAFPFVTVVMSRPVRYDFSGETFVKATLTLSIVGFINESVALDAANSATTPALQLLEDITRALLPASGGTKWNIGSTTIDEVRIVPQQTVVGVADGYEFAEVPIDVELDIRFARADLGPNA